MLSEEEKQAIKECERLSKEDYYGDSYFAEKHSIQILLNLLEKKQREIEKKNKIIDLIAKMINTHDIYDDIYGQFGKSKDCSDFTNEELCVDCIKQYFESKSKEE